MAAQAFDAHRRSASTATADPTTSSGSSSDSSNGSQSKSSPSPPSTPPSDEDKDLKDLKDEEEGDRDSPTLGYAATHQPKRSWRNRHYTPTNRQLGAIDEDSSVVSPDIPMRNPRRNFPGFSAGANRMLFGSKPATMNGNMKPPGLYDGLVGPNGEKFTDVRENKRGRSERRGGWRRLACIGLLVLAIVIGLAVGLGVGLTRKKSNRTENPYSGPPPPNPNNSSFPAGTWAITTYLTTVDTACTSNPSTWRCYPYQTYNQSSTGSLSTLDWSIIAGEPLSGKSNTNNGNWSYLVTANNPTFSYAFSNISLQPSFSSGADSSFTFSYTYRKIVVPTGSLTSDGGAARCYYNNTQLAVTLFTERSKDPTLMAEEIQMSNNGTSSQSSKPWPYALMYTETISEPPQCFRNVNGQDGDAIQLPAGGSGQCQCGYKNYGL